MRGRHLVATLGTELAAALEAREESTAHLLERIQVQRNVCSTAASRKLNKLFVQKLVGVAYPLCSALNFLFPFVAEMPA